MDTSDNDTSSQSMQLKRRTRSRTRTRANEDRKRPREETPEESDADSSASEVDKAGEKKVDRHGYLLQGRKYAVSTFTLPLRGEQLLMLAMDPAKALGYRDSYLFFHKNPLLERVRISEEEKQYLVKERLLVTWFRNRDVAVVTARSVFKCFGSRIVKRGRRLKDDYFESKARHYQTDTQMEVEQEPTEEESEDKREKEREKEKDEPMARRSLLSKLSSGDDIYKGKALLNSATWLHHAAMDVRGFNAQLHQRRIEKPIFYDIHTDIRQIAKANQPSQCTWKPVDATEVDLIAFNVSSAQPMHGFGQYLLDKDLIRHTVLNTLSESERTEVNHIINTMESVMGTHSTQHCKDMSYPIAIMEGQYQAEFPV
ncbi:chromatin remodelling complex Rsc7/Swp82 subunit-domain-containing protein [Spinellus fusiger]|nr:chromatin remodelling complex Rsc7/Swp82 subunit-domain-containing protein [Spinellus fusiger]